MRFPIGKFALVVALLGAAAGGWWWWKLQNAESAPRYRLAKLERGPLAAAVAASGTLNAVTTVQVGSQVSGQVKEILVDFNSTVKKDEIIARIDPATFELRVAQARADLDAARSAVMVARSALAAQRAEAGRIRVNLADAQRDLERKRMLVEKNYISPAELDKARTLVDATREQLNAVEAQLKVNEAQIDSAQAAVKQRESLLKQSEVDLERTIIRAPVDGTVILRNIDAGQTVAASLQAPVLFTIARDLRDMQVEAAIDEADVGRLRTGQPATFTVDAFPRRSFTGEIRQIRKSPVNVQNVISYTVVISASNPDLALLPGMTANVRIVVEQRESALKVANAALRFRPPLAPAEAKDAAPAAASAQQSGPAAAAQAFRQRLLTELKPDDVQKAKLEQILDDARARMGKARDLSGEADRRKMLERVRGETRTRILEVLTAEQRPAYERLAAEMGATRGGGGGAAAPGRVWILEAGGKPKAVDVRTGLSDGTSTEIVSGPLKEGDEVILGTADTAAKKPAAAPGPRMF